MIMKKTQLKNYEKLSYEDAVKTLETLVDSMEGDELSLDDSLENFEKGMLLVKVCEDKLNEASGKIEKIIKNFDGKSEVVAFDEKDSDF